MDLFETIKNRQEIVECKEGHIFSSGYPSCPICKIYVVCDKEDLEENNK